MTTPTTLARAREEEREPTTLARAKEAESREALKIPMVLWPRPSEERASGERWSDLSCQVSKAAVVLMLNRLTCGVVFFMSAASSSGAWSCLELCCKVRTCSFCSTRLFVPVRSPRAVAATFFWPSALSRSVANFQSIEIWKNSFLVKIDDPIDCTYTVRQIIFAGLLNLTGDNVHSYRGAYSRKRPCLFRQPLSGRNKCVLSI
jgi:hypothetical protein